MLTNTPTTTKIPTQKIPNTNLFNLPKELQEIIFGFNRESAIIESNKKKFNKVICQIEKKMNKIKKKLLENTSEEYHEKWYAKHTLSCNYFRENGIRSKEFMENLPFAKRLNRKMNKLSSIDNLIKNTNRNNCMNYLEKSNVNIGVSFFNLKENTNTQIIKTREQYEEVKIGYNNHFEIWGSIELSFIIEMEEVELEYEEGYEEFLN